MSGIFSIGISALNAAYAALRTTGNNIANANTPGYTRQITVLTPQVGTMLGGSYVGQGVAVDDIRRVYNDFVSQAAHQAQAQSSQADARYMQLVQVANLFADPDSGVGAAVDQFFRAVQDLTQRPADPAARQALLSSANLMTTRFRDVGDTLQSYRNGTDQQIRLQVDAVNRALREIAELNDRIALAQGSGSQPNDLLDRRDLAIRTLNESIRVTTVRQDDGSLNVFLGSGQPLVVGNRAYQMATDVDPIDPQNIRIGVRDGATFVPVDAVGAGGGRIAGLLQFRNEDLPRIENELGRLATVLAAQFNAQHRLGDDRNGQPGGDFFRPPVPYAFGAGTNGNPATTIDVAFTDTAQLQPSDYRLQYSGGTYTLTRLADGAQWTSATPSFAQDGLSITLANTPPADGDIFMIQPLRGASRSLATAITQPNAIAAANPVNASLPASNTGSLSVADLAVVGPARNPALTSAVTITFTAPDTYTISDGTTTLTGQTFTAGEPITFNGWSLTLLGTPAAGDTVAVGPNTGGVGDNRNALRLAQLQNAALVDGSTLGSVFASIVARVGGDTQTAELYAAAQTSIYESALAAESSVSGVNLDEEASRLIQFQQQYQAAAKVIATAGAIFEEILSIGR